MPRGVTPIRKNGQFSGYHAPTCGSARNGIPLKRYGVQKGSLPAYSESAKYFCGV